MCRNSAIDLWGFRVRHWKINGLWDEENSNDLWFIDMFEGTCSAVWYVEMILDGESYEWN